jgi:hypothetical protein
MATKALDRPINPRLLYSMDEFLFFFFFFFRKVKTGESTGAHTHKHQRASQELQIPLGLRSPTPQQLP